MPASTCNRCGTIVQHLDDVRGELSCPNCGEKVAPSRDSYSQRHFPISTSAHDFRQSPSEDAAGPSRDRLRLVVVSTSPDQLDPASVAYLRAVEAGAGDEHPGILVQRSTGWFAGPRGGWWILSLLGLTLLAGLVWLCWRFVPEGGSYVPWQTALVGLGTLFLLLGVMRFLRRPPQWLPKSFLFADADYLWDVTPDQIVATSLDQLENVDGTHHYSNGSYSSSTIELRFPTGVRRWSVGGKKVAGDLVNFLQYLIVFRASDSEQVREWAAESSGRLSAAAARLVAYGPDASFTHLASPANPPHPHPIPPDPATPRYGWAGAALCFLCATALGALAFYAFPRLNDYLQDEYLFARVPAQDNGQFEAMDRYLMAFPSGRHADLVRELRDDRGFAKAQRDAEQHHSPGSLRAYLADESNQRHRTAAHRLIGDYYDRVIDDLKKKRAQNPADTDKNLFEGVLALLQGLKEAERPVVTVGFKPTLEREPVTPEQKRTEKRVYEVHLQRKPELKNIAERSANRSAIIEAGEVFNPEQTARREEVILARLSAAVKRGIDADILTLEPVVAGQQPIMEVAYHVLADGDLGTYSDTEKRLVGLLRWYAIRWTITIRPPKTDKTFVYVLRSEPGSQLTYDSEPGDPSWAIYAVILYSGFHDMSARLIRNFGLDPGPSPNAFSFAAVARNAPPEPDKPGQPPIGLPGNLPQWRPGQPLPRIPLEK